MGTDASPIEGGGDFLAGHRWKRGWQEAIVCHGGGGWRELADGIGVDIHILRQISALSYVR